jgi:hypothetical protein
MFSLKCFYFRFYRKFWLFVAYFVLTLVHSLQLEGPSMQNSEKEILVSDSIFYDQETGSFGNNFSDSIFSDPDEISGHNFSDSSRFNSSSGLTTESFFSKVKTIKFVVGRETKYFKDTYKHKQVFFNQQTSKKLINKFLRTWY